MVKTDRYNRRVVLADSSACVSDTSNERIYLVKHKFNSKRTLCPRCNAPLWIVLTEFRFYVPHCMICGFEDYSRTTRLQALAAEGKSRRGVAESDSDTQEVA